MDRNTPTRWARQGQTCIYCGKQEFCGSTYLSQNKMCRLYRGALGYWLHIGRYPKLCRGSDEEQCGLYYDQHQVWRVTVVVTLPDTLPCVLRGKWDQWARAVPHPNVGVISSDIGARDVFVAQ